MPKTKIETLIPLGSARVFWLIQRILLTIALWISLKNFVLPTEERQDSLLGFFWNPAFAGEGAGTTGLYPALVFALILTFTTGWWPGVTAAGLACIILARISLGIDTVAGGMLAGALVCQALVALTRTLRSKRHERLWSRSQRQIYSANLVVATAVGILIGTIGADFSKGSPPIILCAGAVLIAVLGKLIPFGKDALSLPRIKPPKWLGKASARVSKVLAYVPLKLSFVLIIGATAVGEHYPLSPFPMYSQWKPDTYLIYFKDKDGNPIPIQTKTYLKAGRYKGMFDAHLKVIKADHRKRGIKPDLIADFGPNEFGIAGRHVLKWIDKNVHPDLLTGLEPLRPIEVWRRDILIVDGVLTHKDQLVASSDELDGESGPKPSTEQGSP